jgi:hypothetical protein
MMVECVWMQLWQKRRISSFDFVMVSRPLGMSGVRNAFPRGGDSCLIVELFESSHMTYEGVEYA